MSTTERTPQIRTFAIVWLGQLVSIIGTGMTTFVLGVWIYQQTNSVTQLAFVLLFKALPVMILSPFAGALVDRWDKRLTMIFSDTGAALSSLCLAVLFFSGQIQPWHIYIGAAVASAFETFQTPAYLAAVTLLVPQKHYARASGVTQVAQAAAEIFSPLLAGALLLAVQVKGILVIDFATFLVAVTTLLLVRFPAVAKPEKSADEPEQRFLLREIRLGFGYVAARPGLIALLGFFALVSLWSGFIAALIQPLLLSFTTPEVLGAVLSVAGSGLLLGSLLLSVWGGLKRRINGVLLFCFLFGLSLTGMGLRPAAALIAICAFCAHFSIPFINGSNQAIWQSKVAFAMQGRVFAIRQMVTKGIQVVAFLLAGPLADRVFGPLLLEDGALADSLGVVMGTGPGRGYGLMFVVFGALTMLVACLGYLYPRLRRIEDELPDAALVDAGDSDAIRALHGHAA